MVDVFHETENCLWEDGDDRETLHGEFIRRDGTTSDTYRHDR